MFLYLEIQVPQRLGSLTVTRDLKHIYHFLIILLNSIQSRIWNQCWDLLQKD
jgi:hypothetical protein